VKITLLILITILFSSCAQKGYQIKYYNEDGYNLSVKPYNNNEPKEYKLICDGKEMNPVALYFYPLTNKEKKQGYINTKKCSAISSDGDIYHYPSKINLKYIEDPSILHQQVFIGLSIKKVIVNITYDTFPQNADLFCNNNYKGKTPYTIKYESSTNLDVANLAECKAIWSSGYIMNYQNSVDLTSLKSRRFTNNYLNYFSYKKMLTVTRPATEGYSTDIQTDMFLKNKKEQRKANSRMNAQLLQLQYSQDAMLKKQRANSARDQLKKQNTQLRSYGIKTY